MPFVPLIPRIIVLFILFLALPFFLHCFSSQFAIRNSQSAWKLALSTCARSELQLAAVASDLDIGSTARRSKPSSVKRVIRVEEILHRSSSVNKSRLMLMLIGLLKLLSF
jgi:hypothetical protein